MVKKYAEAARQARAPASFLPPKMTKIERYKYISNLTACISPRSTLPTFSADQQAENHYRFPSLGRPPPNAANNNRDNIQNCFETYFLGNNFLLCCCRRRWSSAYPQRGKQQVHSVSRAAASRVEKLEQLQRKPSQLLFVLCAEIFDRPCLPGQEEEEYQEG